MNLHKRHIKSLLSFITVAICMTSCSERLEAIMNPYGRSVESYPSTMDIPPEGGSINLSFESNCYLGYSLRQEYESGFQLDGIENELSEYHRRLELTVSAGANNTQGDLIDTLWVEYRFPTFLLPVNATKKIGDYIIRQQPL